MSCKLLIGATTFLAFGLLAGFAFEQAFGILLEWSPEVAVALAASIQPGIIILSLSVIAIARR